MIAEVIIVAIEEDLAAGLDPSDRSPAPKEFWEAFMKTQQTGRQIAASDVDTLEGPVSIAVVMYLSAAVHSVPAEPDDLMKSAPPPFIIAASKENQRAAHG